MTIDEIIRRGVLQLRIIDAYCQIDGCTHEAMHVVELYPAVHAGKLRIVRVCNQHRDEISTRMREDA